MLLNYRKIGSGQPLFILHGLFGSADNWQTFGKQLESIQDGFRKKQLEIFLIDQRNHGRSFHTDEFDYKCMSDDLHKIVTHEKLSGISILGHSMGGKTAMQYALNYPDKVKKLIVIDIAPRFYPPHHQAELDGLTSLNLSIMEDRKSADIHMEKYIPIPAARQFLLKNIYRDEQNKFQWRMNLQVLSRDIDNVGSEITSDSIYPGDVLFVNGELSNYIKVEDKPQILKLFPNARFKTAPGAGHWVHVDQFDWLLKVTVDFLRDN